LLLVLLKDDCKILVSFEQIQNFEVSNLAMAKVQKFNIAVTLFVTYTSSHIFDKWIFHRLKILGSPSPEKDVSLSFRGGICLFSAQWKDSLDSKSRGNLGSTPVRLKVLRPKE
jgi:hypothetical protein